MVFKNSNEFYLRNQIYGINPMSKYTHYTVPEIQTWQNLCFNIVKLSFLPVEGGGYTHLSLTYFWSGGRILLPLQTWAG